MSKIKTGLKGVALAGLGIASAVAGKAYSAEIRVTAPSKLYSGQTYTAYVEAENTGLGGEATDAVDWRLNAPSYLNFLSVLKPSAGVDFFEGKSMLAETFNLPNGLSGRLVNDYGNGPKDKTWSQLAIYTFEVNNPGSSPMADSLTLTDTRFWDKDFARQTHTVTNHSYEAFQTGDADGDGDVDGVDFGKWQAGYPTASGATVGNGDFDFDGDVDGVDFGKWQAAYPTAAPGAVGEGSSVPVPEPSTIGLLIFGGLALLRGRRQR